jgi:hypothetical protein
MTLTSVKRKQEVFSIEVRIGLEVHFSESRIAIGSIGGISAADV